MGWLILCLAFFFSPLHAQDPVAALTVDVQDVTGHPLAGASASLLASSTGRTFTQSSDGGGTLRFPALAVGEYSLRIEAQGFAPFVRKGLQLNLGDALRLTIQLELEARQESIVVSESAELVQTSTTVLGSVVNSRQILELPLNGRNFTQLGLLQVGVAPLTAGLATHGGPRRSGQGYTVNGQRPESNNYLLDGVRIVNRVDGGFAFRPPVDAVDEFRILTHNAPAEFGGASGSTTTVATRSGSNEFHGALYEFVRNDVLDARNFFSAAVEPLKQHQFGGTLGGPVRRNREFFFAYYEGFRNRQGITRGATVPTAGQRVGDYSGTAIQLVDTTTGLPVPGNRIPSSLISPLSQSLLPYYLPGNVSPSFHAGTYMTRFDTNQGGLRLDAHRGEGDTLSFRYSRADSSNVNPMSILGADLPGFPVGDFLSTHVASLSATRLLSNRAIATARASFFRHDYLMEERLSGLSPRTWGFGYDSTLAAAQGAPAMLVAGYSTFGDPVIGPRDTVQNNYEFTGAFSFLTARHSLKTGGDFRRVQLNAVQGHFANGSFQFTQSPYNDAFANFLTGRPMNFTQAGGDFHRALRGIDYSLFVQDEWKAASRVTVNIGLRYEVNTPFRETRGKLSSYSPGRQSSVFPNAPEGILVPGDPGVPGTIAPVFRQGFMPRLGLSWNPDGAARWVIRTGFGMFFDQLANGVGGPLRVATLSIPWVRPVSLTGGGFDYQNPYGPAGQPFHTLGFARPASTMTIENVLRPPYAQDWNFSLQRRLGSTNVELHYVGTKGTRLPRFIEGNPALYGPGATAGNADRRRIYAGCIDAGPCALGHIGLVSGSTNSTYNGAQLSLNRPFSRGLAYQVSYTFSRLIDYASSLHMAGPSPLLISGENDVAQNPFDLAAERGASLFDARHRFVLSSLYALPDRQARRGFRAAAFNGWQINSILSLNSSTPFTVFDSRNVSLQAPHPTLSGVFASRPDLIADPNGGPRRPEAWLSRSSFRRLDPATEAGRFGNAGRNIARGPAFANWDVSLLKTFSVTEALRLQARIECFNVLNHANLGLPVTDLASPNFGRILESGRPRLFQVAMKFLF
jgi:hypothetical protein